MNTLNIIPLVICVNMSEYLKITLEKNRENFKTYYVLTSPEDKNTKELCKEYNVNIIEYDNFFNNEFKFNKSGGVKFAQNIIHKLHRLKWVLLIDVDIIITEECIKCINETKLNKKFLYGVKRYDLWTKEELLREEKNRLYPIKFAGFFQLYFNKKNYYPNFSINASECDMYFMDRFKYKIELNTYIFHIGKEHSHWDGKGEIILL